MRLTKSQRNSKELHIESLEEARQYIGKRCSKFSGKPFKSGNKVNTITGIGEILTKDGKRKTAFYFAEDGTYVSCAMVYIVE